VSASAFEAWFRAQYGRPPSGWGRAAYLLDVARAQFNKAQEFYDRVRSYEDRRDAAIKAWQARGTRGE
jgi:hypothetical protein